MGISTSIYTNNLIFEKDMEFTVKKISNKINIPCNIMSESNKLNYEKNALNIYLHDFKSINDYYKKDSWISLRLGDYEFWLNEKNVIYLCYPFIPWSYQGLHEFFLKNISNERRSLFFEKIDKIKRFSSLFNSTKMIVFNDDDHQDIEDELNECKSIDEVVKDKRWIVLREPGLLNEEDLENDTYNEDNGTEYIYRELFYHEWENKQFSREEWEKEFLLNSDKTQNNQ
jgi:hypothetical protein